MTSSSTDCPPAYRTAFAPRPSHAISIAPQVIPRFNIEIVHGNAGPQVCIQFAASSSRGVWIKSRRHFGNWEFITITPERSYLDWRPMLHPQQVEIREYCARYFDQTTPGGPWSLIQTIAVEPAALTSRHS